MGRREVQAVVNTVVPCAHMAWPSNSAPALPWATFYLDGMEALYADGRVYATVNTWVVELYQKTADTALESALESAIETNFTPYSKSETWVESENCMQTVYAFTEIERSS